MCRSCATYSTCSLIGSFWSKRSYFTNVLRSRSIHEVLRTDQQISSTRETQPCLASNLASLKLIDPTSQNTVSKKNCNLNQSRGQNQDSRNSWTEKPNADEAKWKDGTEKIKLLRTSCKQGRKWSRDTYHFSRSFSFRGGGGGTYRKKNDWKITPRPENDWLMYAGLGGFSVNNLDDYWTVHLVVVRVTIKQSKVPSTSSCCVKPAPRAEQTTAPDVPEKQRG